MGLLSTIIAAHTVVVLESLALCTGVLSMVENMRVKSLH